jgi:hypothetical protein
VAPATLTRGRSDLCYILHLRDCVPGGGVGFGLSGVDCVLSVLGIELAGAQHRSVVFRDGCYTSQVSQAGTCGGAWHMTVIACGAISYETGAGSTWTCSQWRSVQAPLPAFLNLILCHRQHLGPPRTRGCCGCSGLGTVL